MKLLLLLLLLQLDVNVVLAMLKKVLQGLLASTRDMPEVLRRTNVDATSACGLCEGGELF